MKKVALVLAVLITLFFFFIIESTQERETTDEDGILGWDIIKTDNFFFIEIIQKRETAYVEKVTDGDTIKTDKGIIRLLGINTPEKRQPYYQEAKDFLADMVNEKNVTIEGKEVDMYDRLLRYIYINNVFVNLELVKNGFGSVYMADGIKYENELIEAERTAKLLGKGIWKTGEQSSCFSVSEFVWNAEGNDNKNLNGEYFTLENNCGSVDMSGWTIKDSGRNTYTFSDFIISSVLTVYTGCGNNTKEDIYMCKKQAVWNNDGDVLFLRNENGELVLSYEY